MTSSGSHNSSKALRSAVGLLALQKLPRVGPATALRIALGVEREAWAPPLDWREIFVSTQKELDSLEGRGLWALSVFDREYPERLRHIHNAPPVLFGRGDLDAIHTSRSVAIVGTREPTSFGCSAADEISGAVADAGWTVISGLAKGVDQIAHGATLKHHARTVAVLAGGFDRIYPAENRELAEAIADCGGALVSEHSWGAHVRPSNFVQRNRIQTGLSVAVVIVQTGLKGGTMHTVRHAAEQGRPIFCAVPKSDHPRSAGLRVLLEEPANTLHKKLPAWKNHAMLAARLGDRPLARPIKSDELDGWLELLEGLRVIEEEEKRQPLEETSPAYDQPREDPKEAVLIAFD